jgi:hypothetical protein
MAAFNFHRRQTRRWWLAGTTMAVLAAGILLLAASASGTLAAGTFDTSNGSLYSNANHDWNPPNTPQTPTSGTLDNVGPLQPITCPSTAPGNGTNCALDLVASKSDNALGQGTKEDDTSVSIVDGQIPPNKDDLSRFYINQETANQTTGIFTKGDNLLYLAWERSNLLGSAHMDFELNQNPIGITPTSTGTININRTAGDVLIDFDFGGSGVPTLQWHKWETSAVHDPGTPSTVCAASNTFPCWGVAITIGSAGEASVNGAVVYDYNPPNAPTTLNGTTTTQQNKTTVSSTFGEAGIDLQAAGIFTSFQCTRFGDAWLKSRSSGSSFVSELKDFIAPLPVNISNCGEIKIIKNTDPRYINKDFSYSTTVPSSGASAATFSTTPDSTGPPTTFTLNDRNDVLISSVTAGSPNTTVTTSKANGLTNGENVTITGTASYTTPSIDGTWPVSNVSGNSFTIPFATTAVGSTPAGSLLYNTEDITNVVPGSYTVNETLPGGWSLESLSCVPSDISGANFGVPHSSGSTQADITVAADGVVTCTYVNKPQLGAILITKQAKDHNCIDATTTISEGTCAGAALADLSGAKFQVWSETNGCSGLQTAVSTCNGPNTPADTQVGSEQTTGSDGTTCFDGLSWSGAGTDYYVKESGAPAGFSNDNATAVIKTVTQNAKCTDSDIATTATLMTATDKPLTDLTVNVASELTGATNSRISCVDSVSSAIGNSPQPADTGSPPVQNFGDPETMTANGLKPGTYTCTVVIDP